MATAPKCKLDMIRDRWSAGDKLGALSIASKFFDRSEETKIFKRGQSAAINPGFYRQIGKDPEQVIQAAFDALVAKFSL